MNSTVTVSVKGLLVSALVLLALVVAYLLGGGGATTVLPAQAATTGATAPPGGAEQERTLRLVGTGEVTVVPDQLTFSLSVTSKSLELDTALADASRTMDRVLTRLRAFEVRENDVQTTGLQMYPEYDYPSYGPPVLTGYRVTQRALVKVRDLALGGKAVTAAVETGGNGVRATDLRLGVADPEAGLARARDAAVEAATAKAEQYAAATGQALGDVLGLREVGGRAGGTRDRWAGVELGRVAAYDAALPIRAGKEDLSVEVEVLWEFAE
jgi:uncharacterized protein YggE